LLYLCFNEYIGVLFKVHIWENVYLLMQLQRHFEQWIYKIHKFILLDQNLSLINKIYGKYIWLWCLTPLSTILQLYWRNPPAYRKSLTSFITFAWSRIEYTLPWAGFEFMQEFRNWFRINSMSWVFDRIYCFYSVYTILFSCLFV
jgi:hypothetical protein